MALGLAIAGLQVVPSAAAARGAADPSCASTLDFGQSRRGEPITACQILGSDPGRPPLLLVGSMHGNEKAGMKVAARLRLMDITGRSANVWVIPTINPDGTAANTRGNASRVDLNGNFPTRNWRVRFPGTPRWGGRAPASEPETRALMAATSQIRPTRVIVLHQAMNLIDCPPKRGKAISRQLAELTGYRVRCLPTYIGNYTAWANTKFAGTTAVTFELEARPGSAKLDRVATAVVQLASE